MTFYELLPTRRNRRHLAPGRHEARDPFSSLERRAGRFFDDFFRDFAIEPVSGPTDLSAGFVPDVNITETENEIVISAELPGVDEDDVEVSLSHGQLTIKGEKKHELETKDESCYRMERSCGSFQRLLDLPCDVNEDESSAEFKKGILTITLGKVAEEKEKAKKIEIKSR